MAAGMATCQTLLDHAEIAAAAIHAHPLMQFLPEGNAPMDDEPDCDINRLLRTNNANGR